MFSFVAVKNGDVVNVAQNLEWLTLTAASSAAMPTGARSSTVGMWSPSNSETDWMFPTRPRLCVGGAAHRVGSNS